MVIVNLGMVDDSEGLNFFQGWVLFGCYCQAIASWNDVPYLLDDRGRLSNDRIGRVVSC